MHPLVLDDAKEALSDVLDWKPGASDVHLIARILSKKIRAVGQNITNGEHKNFLARLHDIVAGVHSVDNKVAQLVLHYKGHPNLDWTAHVTHFPRSAQEFYAIGHTPYQAANVDDALDRFLQSDAEDVEIIVESTSSQDAPQDTTMAEDPQTIVVDEDEPMEEAPVRLPCSHPDHELIPCPQPLSPTGTDGPVKKKKKNSDSAKRGKQLIPTPAGELYSPAEAIAENNGRNVRTAAKVLLNSASDVRDAAKDANVKLTNNAAITVEFNTYNDLVLAIERLSMAGENFIIARERHHVASETLAERGINPGTCVGKLENAVPAYLVKAVLDAKAEAKNKRANKPVPTGPRMSNVGLPNKPSGSGSSRPTTSKLAPRSG
uniref:Uncharacterized protein n=1 Tax=Mycena chlorophos TaxID=658473 RepID=A0ABQ0L5F9_MYCCL|nr:predicted protein [Mycena chlorophos]